MPVYRFRCNVCGEVFEKKLPFSEAGHPVKCPNGHDDVARVYTVPSIVFRGSGFYVTDHRSKSSSSDK